MGREAIVAAVKAAGVVGAGGAGFPTHIKLTASADTIIVNGAECEPLLEVDRQLLSLYRHEVLKGLEAARIAIGARQAHLAIKGKYKSLVDELKMAAASRPWLEIATLPDIYPIGDEQCLVYEVLGRIVPPRGIPIDVGAVVLNVETLYNIARAIDGKPVIDTFVTVSGAVAEPATWQVPVGCAIQDVLSWARPLYDPASLAVIEGGPMMGDLVKELQSPVTKTTKGLVVLPQNHVLATRLKAKQIVLSRAFSVCSQCSLCTDLCPRHQLGHPIWPHRIMRSLAGDGVLDLEVGRGALLCSECGVCDQYACFMGLSPRRVNQALKQELLGKGSNGQSSGAKSTFSWLQEVRQGFYESQVPARRLLYRLDLARWAKAAPLKGFLPEPARVVIPLKQHVGKPAHCLVQVGDVVSRGDLLADLPEGEFGAFVHSSITGVVSVIEGGTVVIERGGQGE
ncbi:MAG: electron transport complex protein RnfC [Firmicutes bacterium]|nr:electron transport complex protein RnfC [Bacillota bacterium]